MALRLGRPDEVLLSPRLDVIHDTEPAGWGVLQAFALPVEDHQDAAVRIEVVSCLAARVGRDDAVRRLNREISHAQAWHEVP